MILESDILIKGKLDDLKKVVGNTPLYELKNLSPKPSVRIFAKLEWMQFGGSVKSRPAFQIISDAVKNGLLFPGKNLLDASSGNTAISYASIAINLGISVTICLPENASEERKKLLSLVGVQVVYTPSFGTTDEAQEVAQKLSEERPDMYYYADQYANNSNWKAHFESTGPEIWDQTSGSITHFIAGLGTTGTFTGVGRALKNKNDNIQLIALQPESALHGLEGWKHLSTAKIPDIYDDTLHDEIRTIESERAYTTMKLVAQKEGLMIGPSGAANLLGAMEVAREIDSGTIVTIFPDTIERYGEVLKMNNY